MTSHQPQQENDNGAHQSRAEIVQASRPADLWRFRFVVHLHCRGRRTGKLTMEKRCSLLISRSCIVSVSK